jgi:hypothetical protein
MGRFIGNGLMFLGMLQMPVAIWLGSVGGMSAELAAFCMGLVMFGGGLIIRRFAGG